MSGIKRQMKSVHTQVKKNKLAGSAICNYNSEDLVNEQIMRELQAAHEYRSLAYWAKYNNYFNCAKIFKHCENDEIEHGEKWCKYQDERRGKVIFGNLDKPISYDKITSIKQAFKYALDMELEMNKCLNNFHEISDGMNDYNLSNFIDNFISDQIADQRELEALITFCENNKDTDCDIDYKLAQFIKTVKHLVY